MLIYVHSVSNYMYLRLYMYVRLPAIHVKCNIQDVFLSMFTGTCIVNLQIKCIIWILSVVIEIVHL